MSVLYLVRHGQASVGGDDYDRLSPLGAAQGRALGERWAGRGLGFDRVFLGPRRRHRETCDAVAEVYRRRSVDWPEPEPLPELDEHCGQALIARHLPRLASGSAAGPAGLRRYLKAYQEGTRSWVRGELETPPGLEPWAAFRDRVAAGLGRITAGGPRGRSVAAFTSGGTMAAAVGAALRLGDERIIELSWRIYNTGLTELLFSPLPADPQATLEGRTPGRRSRLTLHTFNATPHLTEPRLLTYI